MSVVQKEGKNSSKSVCYRVYTYQLADDKGEDSYDWKRQIETTNKVRALTKARRLYESGRYKKVEIKKKILNAQGECVSDSVCKSFGEVPQPSLSIGKILALTFGVLAVFIVLILFLMP